MSYYERNREWIIARQMAYHRENREKYLAYMREYNKKYWLAHRPEPKPKPPKPVKPVKEPKTPKPKLVAKGSKPKKLESKKTYDFVVPVYEYPTKIERGNFILAFD
jgi:hypothetical protein